MQHSDTASGSPGLLLRAAALYDLQVWLLTLGRERAFRRKIADLARLETGESVLDIGCGTGSLALEARRRVGSRGSVHAIDASPEMIARARKKAGQAGLEVEFGESPAQALPFPDRRFDAVLSTLMLHHLPRPSRRQCMREVRRVLKPGGRVLAVDFAQPSSHAGGLLARLHRHGHVKMCDIVGLLRDAGFDVIEEGRVGYLNLQFVLASAPAGA